MADLNKKLSDTLQNLTQVIAQTQDTDQQTKLLSLQANVAGNLQVLVDLTFDASLPQYLAATQALDAANLESGAAKSDLNKVAAYIQVLAQAAAQVANLAGSIKL